MVKIRRLMEKDINRIIEIEKESFEYSYPPTLIRQLYISFPDGFLVAEDSNGNIMGYVIATMEWGNGHIVSIAVGKNYRNKGVGALLLNAIEDYLFKKCNAKYIVLEVRFDNINARKFYYKKGYEDKRLLSEYYDDGSDAILMVKKNPYLESNNYYPIIVNMW
ncbi:ribosomal protein S18-alanine N-acetyltransferase [Methanothermococcus okinawensis]|uniref:Ribosomal-protein-alanine acetyltransferase n=1 Tax=Methanothermococcus okinawensis (strain DSM 14208 / JCM 11175 / IH1) TaxID=647113 RepID=F8AL45_METOI|nr:ribosomal protein S18-alanine N-acetyltransferase [Methanothermococcus okinawensis]AEH06483.1 ribosomal-protein-alanine acetyltransferase [Methanothermococcus okinawensis IH1]